VSFDSLCNQTGTVYRRTMAQDSLKSQAVVEVELATIACRVVNLSGTERAMLGGKGVDVSHRIFCRVPTAFTFADTDEIEVSGTRYKVHWLHECRGAASVNHLQIECQELRHG
jgi:hypothetical protein